MPKICYQEKRFSASSLDMIEKANTIIEEYAEQGFDLTLRQLYYQFVSRDLIANQMKEYKRLGSVINDARLAGLIDWETIVDRTRTLRGNSHWKSPASIVRACADQYLIDKWKKQPFNVEVWIEKDALVGVIENVCSEMDVNYFSCRGYTSQSEMWSAGQRLQRAIRRGQTPVIIHLGDHDPSGMDMSRDIADRLKLFTGHNVEVNRIALNPDQIEQYNPPPNPAKTTDARAKAYIEQFGEESWELDALEPSVMESLIRSHILYYRDHDLWEEAMEQENEDKERLEQAVDFLNE